MTHEAMALAWARWNGQRGTAKQVAAIMARLSVEALARMLAARGVRV